MKGKALLLLSGGFDSAVSGYLAQRKGYYLEALHFSSEPLTDNTPEKKAAGAAKKLGIKKLYVANMSSFLAEMAPAAGKYYFVLMKRFMDMIAERVANEKGMEAIVTGENLAQVSSQTLSNVAVIDRATGLPVLRPVLCYDKREIIDKAKEIGVYGICEGKEQCDVLGPQKPATVSRVETMEEIEKMIGIEKHVEKCLKELKEAA